MQRRTFLQLTGLSALTVAAGSFAFRVGGMWWDQTSGDDFSVLSDQEARILGAMADAMFPGEPPWRARPMPNGIDAGVVEAVDNYLRIIDPQTANLLRLVIHAIDDMAVFAGFGLTRFHRRSREERVAVLNAWDTSMFNARRMAFMSLKFVMSTGYCENPAVLRAADIDFSCGAWT